LGPGTFNELLLAKSLDPSLIGDKLLGLNKSPELLPRDPARKTFNRPPLTGNVGFSISEDWLLVLEWKLPCDGERNMPVVFPEMLTESFLSGLMTSASSPSMIAAPMGGIPEV
jgi:hypothetical protein